MGTGKHILQALVGAGLCLSVGCSGSTGTTVATSGSLSDQDKAEITTLLNSPELKPLQPSGITSDGGVVFLTSDSSQPITSDGGIAFVTQSLRAGSDTLNTQQAGPPPPPKRPPRPVKRYGRKVQSQQPLQVDIQAGWGIAGDLLRAQATVTSREDGELDFEPTVSEGLRQKQFRERHVRLFLFQKDSGRWQFKGVSPVQTAPEDEQRRPLQDVRISRVVVTINDQAYPVFTDDLFEAALVRASRALPALHAGDTIKIEVTASNADGSFDPPLFVFLHRPGSPLREHLLDDGSLQSVSGDSRAGDGIFTRTYVVSAGSGRHHIIIDALSAGAVSDDDVANYRAAAMSFDVEFR